jgi:drug/metabolite transporter (DMT)-like permease
VTTLESARVARVPSRGLRARRALPRSLAAGHGAIALACIGASAYGATVVIGRRLAAGGVASATALGIRFALAAVVLAALLALRGAPRAGRGAVTRLLALGAIGYAGQSTLFYLSLQHGTAATSILLFYVYPALVCVIGWAALREPRPCRRTCVALALSAAGTALVATASGPVTIDPLGVVCALGSALVFALYVLAGQRVAHGAAAMSKAMWVAAGAALSCAGRGAFASGGLAVPEGRWTLLIAYGLLTAAAFTLMFAALARLGARLTSVVMTLEALFTVALATLLLSEPLSLGQSAGGVAVLAATVVVARIRAGGSPPPDPRPSREPGLVAAVAGRPPAAPRRR